MRVVAGSEGSLKSRQAELDRHLEALSRFLERHEDAPARCTLVLRSAGSAPARALTLMKDALADAGARAQAILAKVEPDDDLQRLFATLCALSPDTEATALIRWARNPRLLDAHEQAAYGADLCWTGDAMRRDADKRNPLVLFEADAPNAARRAAHAFKALWGASVPVPARHLAGAGAGKPAGALDPAEAPVPAMRPHIQGWPLVRH